LNSYAVDREVRRRQRSFMLVLFILLLFVSVSIKVGLAWGVAIPLVTAAAIVVPSRMFMTMRDKAEGRRRSAGARPAWPARMPATFAREFGSHSHARTSDNTEMLGRLTMLPDGWQWTPSKQQAKLGSTVLTWDASWRPAVQKLWGPWNQGILTFTRPDGREFNLWVHDPNDLARHLVNSPA
jgi:hypothetical protein